MKKIFLLVLFSIISIFSQSKDELAGFWLLDSNSELLKITKDSVTFNSGIFMDGTINAAKKEIFVMNTVLNYEVLGDKMILNFNKEKSKTFLKDEVKNPPPDTLSQIKTDGLINNSKMWISNKDSEQMLLIILNDNTVKFGGIIKSKTSSYSIVKDVILFNDLGNKKFDYQVEGNVLNLIPEGSKEKFIYNKIQ